MNIHLTNDAAVVLKEETGSVLETFLDELRDMKFNPGRRPVKMRNTNANVWKYRLAKEPRILVLFGKYEDESACIVSPIYAHDEAIERSKHFGKLEIQSGNQWEPPSQNIMDSPSDTETEIDLWKSGLYTVPYIDAKTVKDNLIEMEPFLTTDQNEALSTTGPLLLNGGAGSGKTLCLLQRLVNCGVTGKRIYLTLDNHVAKEIELWSTQINSQYKQIQFTSIIEYYASIDKQFGDISKFVYLKRFKVQWAKYSSPFLPELALEEIRSVLKGCSSDQPRDSKTNLLDKSIYKSLGRNESLIPKGDRSNFYHYASKYSTWLTEKEYWDNQDLAMDRILQLKNDQTTLIDAIAIDEIQDFTVLQLESILRSLSNMNNFVCAGDINQKVYRSNFRWENLQDVVKNIGRLRDFPVVKPLKMNLRNSKAIVKIANFLLNEIKKQSSNKNLKDQIIYQDAVSQVEGSVKYVVVKDVNKYLDDIFITPTRFIILPESNSQTNYQSFRFNISQVKGLEQHTVILVDFWAWYKRAEKDKDLSEIHVLRQLLIACTRATHDLYFIESEDHSIFKELDFIQKVDYNELTKRENIKPLQWELTASYYKSHKMVDHEKTAWKYAARSSATNHSYAEAAKCWLKLHEKFKAAICYEEGGELDRALEILENMKMYDRVAPIWVAKDGEEAFELCVQEFGKPIFKDHRYNKRLAHAFDSLGEHIKAANVWNSCSRFKNAAISYMKSDNFERAFDLWIQLKDFKQAAECQVNLGDHKKAAELFLKSSNLEEAAEQFEISGHINSALNVWIKLEKHTKIAECYESLENYEEAAVHWKLAKEFNKQATALERAGKLESAAQVLHDIENWDGALRLWRKLDKQNNVAICLEKMEEFAEAAKIYLSIGNTEKAKTLLEKIGDHISLHKVYSAEGEVKMALDALRKGMHFQEAGDYCMENELYADAEKIWDKLNNKEMLIEVYLGMERWIDAIQMATISGHILKAYEIWEQHVINRKDLYENERSKKILSKLVDELDSNTLYNEAINILDLIGDLKKIAIIYEKMGEIKLAVKCWRYLGVEEQNNNIKIQHFTKIIKLDPNNHDAYALRAFILLILDKPNEALSNYDKAIIIDPNNSAYYRDRAVTFLKLSKTNDAIKNFKSCTEIDPTDGSSYSEMGNLNYDEGNFENALEDFTNAINNKFKLTDSYCMRGLTYLNLGDQQRGKDDLEQGVQLWSSGSQIDIDQVKKILASLKT